MSTNEAEILLVEDNSNDVELALRALKKHNLADKVHLAENGVAALDYIFGAGAYAGRNIQEALRVILLDMNLPKLGGLEVLRKIKSDERTKRIPVVMMSSSKEKKDIVESYKLGVNSYIVKPVNFGQFEDCVSELGLYWLLLNKLPSRHNEL
ncbi:MAG: response regulator [Planctomycetota bacterium]|jgi:CheY-like chemotaxis protein